MSERSLKAELRLETGKNANRRIRKAENIPAILYSHGQAESLKVAKKDFYNLFKGKISESIIFTLNISDKEEQKEDLAFVKSYQADPVTGDVLHLDFFRVTKGEKIQTQVPFKFIGTSQGVKEGGVMDILEREVEVECLPKNLPEFIEVDVSSLVNGESIHAKDLKLSEEIKILMNSDNVLVSVHAPRTQEEEVVEGEEGESAEATEQGDENKDKKESEENTKS